MKPFLISLMLLAAGVLKAKRTVAPFSDSLSVSGKVVDPASGQVLIGVSVQQRSSKDSILIQGMVTDSLGRFRFR